MSTIVSSISTVDQSRVKLPCAEDDPAQGYINASYLPVCILLVLSIHATGSMQPDVSLVLLTAELNTHTLLFLFKASSLFNVY